MISEHSPLATPLYPTSSSGARGVYCVVICLAALPTDIRHSPTVWVTDGLGSYIADYNNSGMAATTIGSYPAQVCSDITPPTINDGHVKSVRIASLLATNSSGFFYNLTMRGQ